MHKRLKNIFRIKIPTLPYHMKGKTFHLSAFQHFPLSFESPIVPWPTYFNLSQLKDILFQENTMSKHLELPALPPLRSLALISLTLDVEQPGLGCHLRPACVGEPFHGQGPAQRARGATSAGSLCKLLESHSKP